MQFYAGKSMMEMGAGWEKIEDPSQFCHAMICKVFKLMGKC